VPPGREPRTGWDACHRPATADENS